jgi:hypothetical protein
LVAGTGTPTVPAQWDSSVIGIHGGYDSRFNRLLYTFKLDPNNQAEDFTISFSEALNAFESFYDFKPMLYLHSDGKLLSVTDGEPTSGHLHGGGVKGSFYEAAPVDSYITLMVAPNANIPKVFNNLEYNSELFLKDVNGDYTIQQTGETVTTLEYFNDYQESGVITVTVPTNVKRRMRHWRHTLQRDINTTPTIAGANNARFRDYHIFLKLSFDNNNDKRLVLHDIITSYIPARD